MIFTCILLAFTISNTYSQRKNIKIKNKFRSRLERWRKERGKRSESNTNQYASTIESSRWKKVRMKSNETNNKQSKNYSKTRNSKDHLSDKSIEYNASEIGNFTSIETPKIVSYHKYNWFNKDEGGNVDPFNFNELTDYSYYDIDIEEQYERHRHDSGKKSKRRAHYRSRSKKQRSKKGRSRKGSKKGSKKGPSYVVQSGYYQDYYGPNTLQVLDYSQLCEYQAFFRVSLSIPNMDLNI